MTLRVLHNGEAVLNTEGVREPTHGPGAAPEIAELPLTVQGGGVPDNVIMDMRLVDVSADNEGMIALGEPLCKLHADAVGFPPG